MSSGINMWALDGFQFSSFIVWLVFALLLDIAIKSGYPSDISDTSCNLETGFQIIKFPSLGCGYVKRINSREFSRNIRRHWLNILYSVYIPPRTHMDSLDSPVPIVNLLKALNHLNHVTRNIEDIVRRILSAKRTMHITNPTFKKYQRERNMSKYVQRG